MRSKMHRKLFALAAFAAMSAFETGAFAQTSGVGSDGQTRILWRGTDGSVSLWNVDASLNYLAYHAYGPYDGWIPIALTTAPNKHGRIDQPVGD
jgi:hypothetical protein